MFIGYRKASRLGREVDGDDGGDVGDRELISGDERNIGEPGIQIGIEIPDALLASLDQRRDLLIVVRSGNGPVPEGGNGIANRLHRGSKSFQLGAAFPHRNLRLILCCRAEQWWLGMD